MDEKELKGGLDKIGTIQKLFQGHYRLSDKLVISILVEWGGDFTPYNIFAERQKGNVQE